MACGAGWAAFPANGPSQSQDDNIGGTNGGKWDPFSGRVSVEELQTPGAQRQGSEATAEGSSPHRDDDHIGAGLEGLGDTKSSTSGKAVSNMPEAAESTSPEFSNFRYWRQPFDDLLEE